MSDFVFIICMCLSCLFIEICMAIYRMNKAKSVNYDCKNCKIWDCPAHYCNKNRNTI